MNVRERVAERVRVGVELRLRLLVAMTEGLAVMEGVRRPTTGEAVGVSVGDLDRVLVGEGITLRVGVMEAVGIAVSLSLMEGDEESEDELLLVQLEEGVPVQERVAVEDGEGVDAAVPVCEPLSDAVSELV